jgi:hypothetical protein
MEDEHGEHVLAQVRSIAPHASRPHCRTPDSQVGLEAVGLVPGLLRCQARGAGPTSRTNAHGAVCATQIPLDAVVPSPSLVHGDTSPTQQSTDEARRCTVHGDTVVDAAGVHDGSCAAAVAMEGEQEQATELKLQETAVGTTSTEQPMLSLEEQIRQMLRQLGAAEDTDESDVG